jgi:hypothetical protein
MLEVQTLVRKLGKFYWSHLHPNSYTMDMNGKKVGVGLIAGRDYAAFNYAWATTPLTLTPFDWQTQAVVAFTKAQKVTDIEVKDGPIWWHITSRTQSEFLEWYRKNRNVLPDQCKLFDNIPNAQDLHTLRRL